jgi:hypothetical protein
MLGTELKLSEPLPPYTAEPGVVSRFKRGPPGPEPVLATESASANA